MKTLIKKTPTEKRVTKIIDILKGYGIDGVYLESFNESHVSNRFRFFMPYSKEKFQTLRRAFKVNKFLSRFGRMFGENWMEFVGVSGRYAKINKGRTISLILTSKYYDC